MDIHQSKRIYTPPRIVSVAFQVELGAGVSDPVALEVFFDDTPGIGKTYRQAANSGDSFFSGGDDNLGAPPSDYGNFDWGW